MKAVLAAAELPQARRANKAELAEWFGVTVSTIDAWVRKGAPYLQKGQKGVSWVFDIRDIAEWVYGRGSTPADSDDFDPDRLAPKERRDWWESENARLRAERDSGHLCEAHAVEREMHALIAPIAAMLETLPDVLERDASLTPEQAEILQRVIDAERARCAELIEAAP